MSQHGILREIKYSVCCKFVLTVLNRCLYSGDVCRELGVEGISNFTENSEGGNRGLEKTAKELFVLHTKYYPGDQIKDDEMGWTCEIYGREEKCVEFGGETWRKGGTWKNWA
jgi:hypothetical protein